MEVSCSSGRVVSGEAVSDMVEAGWTGSVVLQSLPPQLLVTNQLPSRAARRRQWSRHVDWKLKNMDEYSTRT